MLVAVVYWSWAWFCPKFGAFLPPVGFGWLWACGLAIFGGGSSCCIGGLWTDFRQGIGERASGTGKPVADLCQHPHEINWLSIKLTYSVSLPSCPWMAMEEEASSWWTLGLGRNFAKNLAYLSHLSLATLGTLLAWSLMREAHLKNSYLSYSQRIPSDYSNTSVLNPPALTLDLVEHSDHHHSILEVQHTCCQFLDAYSKVSSLYELLVRYRLLGACVSNYFSVSNRSSLLCYFPKFSNGAFFCLVLFLTF